MQNSLVTKAAETSMAMYDLDTFAYDNIAKDRKEGEHCREGGFAVYDEERHIVDFQAIGKVPYACSTGIRMSDDYDLVATINEFLGIISGRKSVTEASRFPTVDSWYM